MVSVMITSCHFSCRLVAAILGCALLAAPTFGQGGSGAGPGNVTIDADTVWPEDDYELDSLTVRNGATLTIAGGSTLGVVNAISVVQHSMLVLQGKNVAAQVGGAWRGAGVEVSAGDVSLEAGSAISADGQGYIGTAGPGAGASDPSCAGPSAGGGGGNGGGGGAGALGAGGGAPYGSALEPADLGSGGGNNPGCSVFSTENAGGGLVDIEVENVLQLDGTITARGAGEISNRLGGGAGGSIRVRTQVLTGSGFFSADGADGGSETSGGGGGGRIAVSYERAPAFSGFSTSSAAGGSGFVDGQPGTVAFFDTSTEPPSLFVYAELVLPQDSSVIYDAITLDDAATMSVGGGSTIALSGELTVRGNSTLLLQGKNTDRLVAGEWQGRGVSVQAMNVSVEAGSRISAAGQGYIGSAGPGAGASDPSCGGPSAGGGGGYGGAGGAAAFGTPGGAPYGSPIEPVELGSGGGNNPGCSVLSTANAGGGAIVIDVGGALELDGRIDADAAAPLAERLGGGSGGSILVRTGVLTGSGLFSADGADGGNSFSGGGGGGRIAVEYQSAPSFAGFSTSRANGGSGYRAGEPGTVAFLDASTPGSRLRVFQDLVFAPDSTIEYDAIELDDGATLRVGGGSTIRVSDALTLAGASTLVLEGKNVAEKVLGEWKGSGVGVTARNVTVQAGSRITADGQGYVGTAGPGAGANDPSCGGPSAGGGGGYGGAGGAAAFGTPGGAPYGSPVEPVELGSGGGNNPGCSVLSTANAGGGAIVLDVGEVLQLDGVISADAAGGLAERLGGGAGGSILVSAGVLTGSGSFSADGADAGSVTAGGGSGGRVAVRFDQAPSFGGFAVSSANGGSGNQPGEPGTVGFFDTSVEPPILLVFENMVFGEDSLVAYDSIFLDDVATMRVGGGSSIEVNGDLVLRGRSQLLLEGKNRNDLVVGEWQGEGVNVRAANLTVEAGSSISAGSQGYLGTKGPGAGGSEPSCFSGSGGGGGGHGGRGGAGLAGAAGGETYGSAVLPVDLGSGGGNNPGCGFVATVNVGGGSMALSVSGTLRLDGTIRADAFALVPERLGGGAGGSILVDAGILIGGGIFSAAGADAGSANAGGGGGGRIAVYAARGAAFGGRTLSSVAGGSGFADGEPGTLRFADSQCDGDCNEDGTVNVSELIQGVARALSDESELVCAAVDADGSDSVSVDELVRAVNRALDGCAPGFARKSARTSAPLPPEEAR
jgi:hypothetical protein